MYNHGNRGINLQHGELSLVYVLDVFLQRASSRSPVQIVNVIARAGPIYADERQRYAKNGGVHGVDQRLDILFRDELLLDRRLRPSFQFARWYVAAGYLNLIRILELLPGSAVINFGCTDNYEQSYENENGSPHRRGESAFTWTRKGKREKEKKGEKNRFASKELKIVLARLDPGPDPALDWVLLPREEIGRAHV